MLSNFLDRCVEDALHDDRFSYIVCFSHNVYSLSFGIGLHRLCFLSPRALHCLFPFAPCSIQFLAQLICDVSDYVVSSPACPAARPRRICSRSLADASSLPYSSCQFHHSYG